MLSSTSIQIGNLVDVWKQEIYPAKIFVKDGKINSIKKTDSLSTSSLSFILPGFIDSHIHIESSMLIPSEFARLAVTHGTVATVSDPHEIANVCGIKGIEFMIDNGEKVPFKFYFGAPSCVPATDFETAGAAINSDDVKKLLQKKEIYYLSEMMNFPAVLNKDLEVFKKIKAAYNFNKPVDGHAPGLKGRDTKKYIDAGITTDHECFTKEEALYKLKHGMKIIIREGSAAKNFDVLIDLLNDFPDKIMFSSDDKHPDSLLEGHINRLCARAVTKGIDIFKILSAACVNPVLHYNLDVGLLREKDAADFILVKDLKDFKILQTYINGNLVAENGKSFIKSVKAQSLNNFNCSPISTYDIKIFTDKIKEPYIIEALNEQLITNKLVEQPTIKNGEFISDTETDILKIIVVNRYYKAPIAKAFIKNFNIKNGAIASSVAHDSHNIIAVGADDESIVKAVNLIVKEKGGISCVNKNEEKILPLPVAGLMSADDGYKVAEAYTEINKMAKENGSCLTAPFMTLSFMALLVIPHLKLSDKGLFDSDKFELIN